MLYFLCYCSYYLYLILTTRFYFYSDERFYEDCGIIQLIMFTWIFPIIKKGLKNPLQLEDFGRLSTPLTSKETLRKIKKYLFEEVHRVNDITQISLMRVYLRLSRKMILAYFVMNCFGIAAEFIGGVSLFTFGKKFGICPDYIFYENSSNVFLWLYQEIISFDI